MKKLKFAIIGCGRISYKHVEALVNNKEEAELVATCDVVLEKAEAKKERIHRIHEYWVRKCTYIY